MNTIVIHKLIAQATAERDAAKYAWRNETGTLAAYRAADAYLNELRWERDNLTAQPVRQAVTA